MGEWIDTVDVDAYAIRQVEACDILEDAIDRIHGRYECEGRIVLLFDCLKIVHRRQKKDLLSVVECSPEKRSSYYFNRMFEENLVSFDSTEWNQGEMVAALCILSVAYLRGNLRYRCLEKHDVPLNKKFIHIWEQFNKDSSMNHYFVINALYESFNPIDVTEMMHLTLCNDERIVKEMEDHKNGVIRNVAKGVKL